MWASARHVENVFLQVQEGIADESVLTSHGWTGRPTFRQSRFREWWSARRERFDPDFVAAFESEYDLAP